VQIAGVLGRVGRALREARQQFSGDTAAPSVAGPWSARHRTPLPGQLGGLSAVKDWLPEQAEHELPPRRTYPRWHVVFHLIAAYEPLRYPAITAGSDLNRSRRGLP
jgi:hypothetical protein